MNSDVRRICRFAAARHGGDKGRDRHNTRPRSRATTHEADVTGARLNPTKPNTCRAAADARPRQPERDESSPAYSIGRAADTAAAITLAASTSGPGPGTKIVFR